MLLALLALATLHVAVLLAAQSLATTVVPGWKKGPLIDPAAPYAPENALPLFAGAACLAADAYLLLLLLGRRQFGRRAWLPPLALALALGVGEGGLRLWLGRHQLTYFRPHPELHWQVRPNLARFYNRSGGGHLTTNADGMREVRVPRAKAPDEYRILVLGDSSNFGHGVEGDQMWSAQLEGLLADKVPGRRVVVLNGACPGWTTYQGVRFLATTGLAYQPDLVLAGFNNDPGPEYLGDAARATIGPVRALNGVLWRFETWLLAREVVLSTARRFFPPP